ncbi:TetR/AcrR family transcriptional regulator [Paeniglutamicibacter sulfureus]|uniref:TetR/AcrR family transcriptional regulator n=1 Tax=Paeniglutamicibacter sulfureus TaxID=43666 RepID=UPI002666740A|nr:TetR/AcrR family transcriptional regulator [Paeniglutamicibacter sulfureus]MDO2934240.1 TetR/AcrR family transcriptional regulator [Paeniglutamicibacter sulfureus]
MPKLWSETIDAHRQAVRGAVLDAAAAVVADHGLMSVTMSKIAERTGIGRATLYKYFPDVDAILTAWHQRQIHDHLAYLSGVRDSATGPSGRLRAVLEAYALITFRHGGEGPAALLHQGNHVAQAQEHLTGFLEDLVTEAANAGALRKDLTPVELAGYCLHATAAAREMSSEEAVLRLILVILTGIQEPSGAQDAHQPPR